MTEENRRIDRRTVLKGVAATGVGLAASGTATGRTHPTPHTITIRAQGRTARYEIKVSGEIVKGSKSGGGERILDGNVARGVVGGNGEDDFHFSGRITSFRVDRSVKVFVNGKQVDDPVGLPRPKRKLPNKITIQAQGKAVQYAFRVGGRVEKGPRADDEDDITGGDQVRGVVGGRGTDDFRYSGAIAFDSEDGPLKVTLDINST